MDIYFLGGGGTMQPSIVLDAISWAQPGLRRPLYEQRHRDKMDIENNYTMQKRSRWWMQRRRGAFRATAIGTLGARAVR